MDWKTLENSWIIEKNTRGWKKKPKNVHVNAIALVWGWFCAFTSLAFHDRNGVYKLRQNFD